MCFLLFFVAEADSYHSIEEKWISELKRYCPKAAVVLVKNKSDLRKDLRQPIITDMGKHLALGIKTVKYFEYSATTDENGLEYIFEEAVWALLCQFEKEEI